MRKFVLASFVALLALGLAVPAGAAPGDVIGSITTACTTRLDDFPQSGPFVRNSDDCDADDGISPNSSLPAIDFADGALQLPTGMFVAGGMSATRVPFSYNENCNSSVPGTTPLVGLAKGNFVIQGTFNGLPAHLLAGFTWTRTGVTAVIGFTPTLGGHDLDTGQVIEAGLFGIKLGGPPFTSPVVPLSGVSAQSVGLLQVHTSVFGASGNNSCPLPGQPDPPGQWEVVTAYSSGVMVATS